MCIYVSIYRERKVKVVRSPDSSVKKSKQATCARIRVTWTKERREKETEYDGMRVNERRTRDEGHLGEEARTSQLCGGKRASAAVGFSRV